jgi:ubiquitin-protein ligase
MALIIGSKNTPYENGCFIFNIFLEEDYPNVPPRLNFETTNHNKIKFSPKLPINGNVILPNLSNCYKSYETWNKDKSTILDILISIQSKIFVKEPLSDESIYKKLKSSEKYYEFTNDYNSKLLYNTYKYAILDKIINPNEEFKDVILNHFKLKKNDIILNINNNSNLKDLINLDILEKLNNL